MTFDLHSNFAYSVVAIAPAPATSGTSLTVSSGQGALFPTPPFNAVVWPGGSPLPLSSNAEIIRVTARAGDAFTTIIRSQEDTNPVLLSVGYQIMAAITAKTLTDIETTQQSGVGNYRGTWSGATTYALGDSVSRSGYQYISTQNGNLNHDPTTDTSFVFWSPLVPTAPLTTAGDIVMSGATSRVGCLLCDGAPYSTGTWPALFNQIGYAFGGGSGTFNVPDLRGRGPVGPDSMNPFGSARGAAGVLLARTLSSVANANTLGGLGGDDGIGLIVAEQAPHTHGYSGNTGGPSADHGHHYDSNTDNANAVANAAFYVPLKQDNNIFSWSFAAGNDGHYAASANSIGWVSNQLGHVHHLSGDTGGASASHSHAFSGTTDNGSGSSNVHENMAPYQVVNFFIYHG